MRKFEPDLAERLAAQAKAKAAMLERLKPKPSVQAQEVIPWDERELQRIRKLTKRPRRKRGGFERVEIACVAPSTVVEVSARVYYAARPDPIRFTVVEPSEEFAPAILCTVSNSGIRRRGVAKAWRLQQWHEGNRRCTYCTIKLVMPPKKGALPENAATVDHKHPLGLGGDDAPWNWAMCCYGCNGAKGQMTEAEYRALFRVATFAERPR